MASKLASAGHAALVHTVTRGQTNLDASNFGLHIVRPTQASGAPQTVQASFIQRTLNLLRNPPRR